MRADRGRPSVPHCLPSCFLYGLIKVRDLGATRCGASATVQILDEYRRREAAEQAGENIGAEPTAIGKGGY